MSPDYHESGMILWKQICELEPGLLDLYTEAAAVKDDGKLKRFCANDVWTHRFKPRLVKLVGWDSKIELLQSTTAYDVAYHMVYDVLPDCRNCSCIGIEPEEDDDEDEDESDD